MFNKNTILSVMIIGSLVFLFFNQHGIITLMKKQSRNNKLKIELQNILEEKKNLKIENKNLDNLTEQQYEVLRKSKGILKKGEKVIVVSPK
jgi:regulator of replication initiation timing